MDRLNREVKAIAVLLRALRDRTPAGHPERHRINSAMVDMEFAAERMDRAPKD